MRTATIKNMVLYNFLKALNKSTRRQKQYRRYEIGLPLGKKFYTNEEINNIVVVESVTIRKL